MKKKFFIPLLCLIMTASVTSLSAQQAITKAQFPYDITKTIVKEYIFPSTVSYVETKGVHYFAFADASMNVFYQEFDKNIFVQDFKIFKEFVYFCGYDKTNGCQGVWGYFKVLDLKTSNAPYNTYSSFNCSKHTVDTLHSIVVYSIQSSINIVTVGTTTDGGSVKNGCTIHITPSTSGIYNWDYTIGVTPDATDERIKYLCETDNLIVSAGSSSLFSDMETYRVHKKSDIFSVTGQQDDIWYFAYSTAYPYLRNTDKFAITHTMGDNMAMAFQSKKILPSPTDCILLYEYDMSTLTNGTSSTLNPLAVSTSTYPFEVEGLVYSSNSNSLSLLMTGHLPFSPLNGYGSIVAEITPGTTYANLHGLKDIELHSIDNYNYKQNFVCLGTDLNDYKNATFYTQPLNTSINCTDNAYIFGVDPIFLTKMHTYPYKLCSDSFNCNQKKGGNLEQTPNNVICQ